MTNGHYYDTPRATAYPPVPGPSGQYVSAPSTPIEETVANYFHIPPKPPANVIPPARSVLRAPVALPRTSEKYDSPFIRAYAPELAQLDVSVQQWAEFIDGLSMAMISSPPLKVLDAVGAVVGMAPSLIAAAVGTGIQVFAQAGQRYFSKSLTDKYLARANRDYFLPRGLCVRLMKGRALKTFCGCPITSSDDLGAAVVALRSNGMQTEASPVSVGAVSAFTRRRLAIMQGYIASLTFNLPPPRQDYESYLRKASAAAVQRSMNDSHRKQARSERQVSMLAVTEGRMGAEQWIQTQQGTFARDRKGMKEERKMLKQAHKQEKRYRKGKSGGKLERRAHRGLSKETKLEDTLLWLVVYPAEMDASFAGTSDMDNDGPTVMSEAEYNRYLHQAEEEERDASDTDSEQDQWEGRDTKADLQQPPPYSLH